VATDHPSRPLSTPQPASDDLLTGTCRVCGTTADAYRYAAEPPAQAGPGRLTAGRTNTPFMWEELWSVECPGRVSGVPCKARLYLRRADGKGA
jgi:hypothetical protein